MCFGATFTVLHMFKVHDWWLLRQEPAENDKEVARILDRATSLSSHIHVDRDGSESAPDPQQEKEEANLPKAVCNATLEALALSEELDRMGANCRLPMMELQRLRKPSPAVMNVVALGALLAGIDFVDHRSTVADCYGPQAKRRLKAFLTLGSRLVAGKRKHASHRAYALLEEIQSRVGVQSWLGSVALESKVANQVALYCIKCMELYSMLYSLAPEWLSSPADAPQTTNEQDDEADLPFEMTSEVCLHV